MTENAERHSESYFTRNAPAGGQIVITGPEARHIARVMRRDVGSVMSVVDGAGTEYQVELTAVRADRVVGRVLGTRAGVREPKHRVAIAQAVLKGDHLAQVCSQATELGVSRVAPFLSARVVGRLSPARLERLRAVSLAALKSSTRTVLPTIDAPVEFDSLLKLSSEFDQVLVAYEDETGPGLQAVLKRDASSFLVVVGPEGGFEPLEVEALKGAGAMSFSLGPRRLRAETAAVAVAAVTLGLLGDLG
ncbi:16S rRNA (uracil(1498)-N(3))-methyltransferase [candidate division WOR-3 bacterium]|uniref:Ribosomal RNA small subunit methyltransferase E n=1 Tax=candidate division WOR-3 bacterium TaxID=2052148 RepID=A0A937XGQ3_UNCW3|nr:16S rRNA (uracil(1498)-N(3))-methyltransferase [candidate division WOR-3 bacterium]